MKSDQSATRQVSSERNQKIASIITLLITISAKIEKIKQKLCGFSPIQFSPQCIFQALDLTSKGCLDLYDIRSFLGNQNIKDKDIVLLFIRCSNTGQTKMTYLTYLNFLKPYFNLQLARDLIKRDTMFMKRGKYQRAIQTQETVLLLVNQLILLHCVCIAEHQELKEALLDEYMLNILELCQIIGLQKGSPLKAIHEFIESNSQFDVQERQTKYLLSYLKVHQYDLLQQNVLSALFMPAKLSNLGQILKASKGQKIRQPSETNRQPSETNREPSETNRKPSETNRFRQQLHQNYDKVYLGKQDLFTNTNKLSFLNYIHPNSIQNLPPVKQLQKNRNIIQSNRSQVDSNIAQEHQNIGLSKDSSKLRESYQRMKKINVYNWEEKLDQSVVEASNLHVFKDVPHKLNNPNDQLSLHTPVLQQFMHQSNIKKNMGHYNGYVQNNQLNTLLEQRSNISGSQAFVRVEDYHNDSSRQINRLKRGTPARPDYYKNALRNPDSAVHYNPMMNQLGNPKQNLLLGINKGQGVSILSQFIRGDIA